MDGTKTVDTGVVELLECLHNETNNPEVEETVLLSVAQIAETNDGISKLVLPPKDLDEIIEKWFHGVPRVTRAAIYCLATLALHNERCKKYICTGVTFTRLYSHLCAKNTGSKTLQAAVYLCLTLTTSNSIGQNLLRKSKCLQRALQLFQCSCQSAMSGKCVPPLLSALSSLLSAAVNNPTNEENQRMCMCVFPCVVTLLEEGTRPDVIQPLAKLLSLITTDNILAQSGLSLSGGVSALVGCLQRLVIDKQWECAACVVYAIDRAIVNNACNASHAGSLGVITPLLELLRFDCNQTRQLKVLMAIVNATDVSAENLLKFVSAGGIGQIISVLGRSENLHVSTAARYLLLKAAELGGKNLSGKGDSGLYSELSLLTGANLPGACDIPSVTDMFKALLDEKSAVPVQALTQGKEKSCDMSVVQSGRSDSQTVLDRMHLLEEEVSRKMSALEIRLTSHEQRASCGVTKVHSLSTPFITPGVNKWRRLGQIVTGTSNESKVVSEIAISTPAVHQFMKKQGSTQASRTQRLLTILEQEDMNQPSLQSGSMRKRKYTSSMSSDDLPSYLATASEGVPDGNTPRSVPAVMNQSVDELPDLPVSVIDDKNLSLSNSAEGNNVTPSKSSVSKPPSLCLALSKSNAPYVSIQSTEVSKSLEKKKSAIKMISQRAGRKTPKKRPETAPAVIRDTRQGIENGDKRPTPKRVLPGFNVIQTPVKDRCADGIQRLLATPNCDSSAYKHLIKTPRMQTPVSVKKRGPGSRDLPGSLSVIPICRVKSVTPDIASSRVRRSLNDTDFRALPLNGNHTQGTGNSRVRRSLKDTDFHETPLNGQHAQGTVNGNQDMDTDDKGSSDDSLRSDEEDEFDDSISTKNQKKRPTKCPGCLANAPFVTSRNYNHLLSIDPWTCARHRQVRQAEIQYQKRIRRNKLNTRLLDTLPLTGGHKASSDVYEYTSTVNGSPPHSLVSEESGLAGEGVKPRESRRRPRVPYTKQEEYNIRHGVSRLGRFWKQILYTYDFHESRTALDIMEKYKRMLRGEQSPVKSAAGKSKKSEPWSIAEENKLKLAVKEFGHHWSGIERCYFLGRRSSREVRDKWRTLERRRRRGEHLLNITAATV